MTFQWPSDALTIAFLLAAALSLVVAGIVLPRLVQRLWKRPGLLGEHDHVAVQPAMMASAAGVSAIAGAGLAFALGGPRALPWLWVTALLGAGAVAAETALGVTFRRSADATPSLVHALRSQGGRIGGWLGSLYALLAAFALIMGFALLTTSETSSVVAGLSGTTPAAASLVMGAASIPLVLMPRRSGRRSFLTLVPYLLLVWLGLCVAAIVTHSEAATHLFQVAFSRAETDASTLGGPGAGMTGGLVAAGIFAGLSRGWLFAQGGLGIAASLEENGDANNPYAVATAAAAGPLVGGLVVATLTFVALGAADVPARHRIDERTPPPEVEATQEAADALTPRVIIPGPAHARGLLPHLEFGQLIVLPEDTPLEHGRRYPMVWRANARGHKSGTINPDRNAIMIPKWQIADHVDEVVFRPRKPSLNLHPAYDVVVPVERKIELTWRNEDLEKPESEREDIPVYSLFPKDPDVNLADLAKEYDGPYIVFDDFEFIGTVKKARHHQYGDFKAMFEDREPSAPDNPVLRSIVAMGFSGPFFPGHGHDDSEKTLVLASEPGFSAPVGSVIEMTMHSPPRGLPVETIGKVVRDRNGNKDGEVSVPAWDFLAGTKLLRLRHREDPALDAFIQVDHRIAEDGTLRFWPSNPEILKLKTHDKMKDFAGVALEVPDYTFSVEVRSGTRLPELYADRMMLVPLADHPYGERPNDGLYHPHPVEVLVSDMTGPWVEYGAGQRLGAAMATTLADYPPVRYLGALVLCLLGIAGITVVADAGGRALDASLGAGARFGYGIAFAVAAAFAPIFAGSALEALAMALIAATAVLGLVGVTMLVRRLR